MQVNASAKAFIANVYLRNFSETLARGWIHISIIVNHALKQHPFIFFFLIFKHKLYIIEN